MTVTVASATRRQAWTARLAAMVMTLIVLLVSHVPRSDAVLLGLLSMVVLLGHGVRAGAWARHAGAGQDRFLMLAMAVFVAYLFANAAWSLDSAAALAKAATVTILFVIFFVIALSFRMMSRQVVTMTGYFLVWGALISLGLLFLEFWSDHAMRELLFQYWPAIRPGDNEIAIVITENGRVTNLPEKQFGQRHDNERIILNPSSLNRNVAMVLLLQWPLLLVSSRLANRRFRLVATGLLCIFAMSIILMSVSETSQLALAASAAVFLMAWAWPRFTHRAVVAAWCVAVVMAVPLSALPYKLGLHEAEWVFKSARGRVATWHFTASRIANAPVLGTGIRSTRVINKELKRHDATVEEMSKDIAPDELRRHAHNQYLQIWYELGALGAFLLLPLGLSILRRIRQLDPRGRRYAYATFVAVCVIAAFGWGLWQTWLLAAYTLAAIFLVFARVHAGAKA